MAEESSSGEDTNPGGEAIAVPKKVIGRPFPKGISGNPGGGPSTRKLRKKLRALEPAALEALKQALAEGGDGAIRAATIIFAYRYGKPNQQVQHTGADGEELRITIEIQRSTKE